MTILSMRGLTYRILANGKAIPAAASSFPSIPGFIYPLCPHRTAQVIIPPASTHRYLITTKAIQDYHINRLDDGTSSADEVEVDLGLTALLQWTSSSQISSSDLGPASHHQLHRPRNSKASMFPAFSAIVVFTQKALTATQKSMLHVQGDYLILTFWRKSGKMSEPGRTKKIRHFTPPFLPAPKSPPIPYFNHTTPDSSPIVKSAHFKNYRCFKSYTYIPADGPRHLSNSMDPKGLGITMTRKIWGRGGWTDCEGHPPAVVGTGDRGWAPGVGEGRRRVVMAETTGRAGGKRAQCAVGKSGIILAPVQSGASLQSRFNAAGSLTLNFTLRNGALILNFTHPLLFFFTCNGFVIDAQLDVKILEQTLCTLVEHRFTRAGASLAVRNGAYEFQIPQRFDADTRPIAFTAQDYPEQ
ncbi:hypothetical protein C8J57DRAFT_1249002 [Mycena rebaudengoi]|nr:hypothetical protein C8J57DRAFT_1249002 [Mycena rebaudengoi]